MRRRAGSSANADRPSGPFPLRVRVVVVNVFMPSAEPSLQTCAPFAAGTHSPTIARKPAEPRNGPHWRLSGKKRSSPNLRSGRPRLGDTSMTGHARNAAGDDLPLLGGLLFTGSLAAVGAGPPSPRREPVAGAAAGGRRPHRGAVDVRHAPRRRQPKARRPPTRGVAALVRPRSQDRRWPLDALRRTAGGERGHRRAR